MAQKKYALVVDEKVVAWGTAYVTLLWEAAKLLKVRHNLVIFKRWSKEELEAAGFYEVQVSEVGEASEFTEASMSQPEYEAGEVKATKTWGPARISLAEAQERASRLVQHKEEQVRSQGVVVQGHRIASDAGVRSVIASISAAVSAGATYAPFPLRAVRESDGKSRRILVDLPSFRTLTLAFLDLDVGALVRSEELDRAIDESQSVTEVASAMSNLQEGWPE